MAVELATAYVSIIPSARGISALLSRELASLSTPADNAGKEAGKSFASRFSSSVGSFVKSGAGALGLAAVGVLAVKQLSSAIGEAEEAQRVTRDTAAVIKSMGGAANISAAGVAALSSRISDNVGVDDELIQTGANLLLTFGNIRNEVGKGNDIFNQATQVAVDLAARFKTDIPSASKIVGKALNDPIKGLTALQRVGVQFTQAQKDQITAMVESGNIMGAQKVIMAELTAQTAGSAEAQATSSDKMKVAFENLQETVGTALLPVVEKFSDWITKTAIPAITAIINWMQKNKTTMIVLASIVGGVLVAAFTAWAVSVIAATWPLLAIGAAVGLLAVLFIKHFDTIKKVALGIFNWFKNNWPLLVGILTGPIGIAVVAIVKHWDKIKDAFSAAVNWVLNFLKANWPLIVGILTGPIGVAVALIIRHWDTIKDVFSAGVDFVLNLWRKTWTAIKDFFARTAAQIMAAIRGWKDALIGFFSNALNWLVAAGRNIITGLLNGMKAAWTAARTWVMSLRDRVVAALGNVSAWLFSVGKDVVRGFVKGIKDAGSYIKDAGKWLYDQTIGRVTSLFGIGSPSTEMAKLGKFAMQGFIQGIGGNERNLTRMVNHLWNILKGAFAKFGFFGGAGKGVGGGALTGLEDRFEGIVRQILKMGGGAIQLVSGWRSTASQARLYYNYIHGIGGQALAAPPGRSKHERGLAVDWGGNRALYTRLSKMFGLVAPVPGEHWHWQPLWAGQTRSYYEQGAWRTRNEWARLHAGEMVLPARVAGAVRGALGGGVGAPGVVVGPVNVYASTTEEGRASAKGFLDELARRRILTDARIA
jgi:hypothetical protein